MTDAAAKLVAEIDAALAQKYLYRPQSDKLLNSARSILAAREAGPGREQAQFWRDDAFQAAAKIAERYEANPHCIRDILALVRTVPLDAAPKSAEPVPSSEAIAAARSDWLIPREYLPDERK